MESQLFAIILIATKRLIADCLLFVVVNHMVVKMVVAFSFAINICTYILMGDTKQGVNVVSPAKILSSLSQTLVNGTLTKRLMSHGSSGERKTLNLLSPYNKQLNMFSSLAIRKRGIYL